MQFNSWLPPAVAAALIVSPLAGGHASGRPGAAELASQIATAAAGPAPLVTDVIPEGTSRRGLAAPPVSPAMAGANAIAQAQAIRQAEALRLGRRSRPAARAIAQTQQPQVRKRDRAGLAVEVGVQKEDAALP